MEKTSKYTCHHCGEPVEGPGEMHGKCFAERSRGPRAATYMAIEHEREAFEWIMEEMSLDGKTSRHWSNKFPVRKQ